MVMTPSTIMPGKTPDLVGNCTLSPGSRDQYMAQVNSIILSHSQLSQDHGFKDLYSVSTANPIGAHVFSDNLLHTNQGTGGILSNSDHPSFIEFIYWLPNRNSTGWFRCQAFGIDSVGHSIILTSPAVHVTIGEDSTVSTTTPSNDVCQKLTSCQQDLHNKVMTQEQTISDQNQKISTLENQVAQYKSELNTVSRKLDALIASNQTLGLAQTALNLTGQVSSGPETTDIFYVSDSFKGTRYYLSRRTNMSDQDISDAVCYVHGGYLAEINDKAEYDFIQQFIGSLGLSRSFRGIHVGGKTSPRSLIKTIYFYYHFHDTMYFDWSSPDLPGNHVGCLILDSWYQWKMSVFVCESKFAFLCEVPDHPLDN